MSDYLDESQRLPANLRRKADGRRKLKPAEEAELDAALEKAKARIRRARTAAERGRPQAIEPEEPYDGA